LLRNSPYRVKDNGHSRCVFFEALSFIVDDCMSTQTPDLVHIGGGSGGDHMEASLLG
jgi:hypothetical protein